MADDADDKDAKLAAEWERLAAEYGEDAVLRFSRKAKKKEQPKGKGGRPLLADEVALSAMADLLLMNLQESERRAAAAVVESFLGLEGASMEAKIHRLCRKYRAQRAGLEAEAARRRKPEPRVAAIVARPSSPSLPAENFWWASSVHNIAEEACASLLTTEAARRAACARLVDDVAATGIAAADLRRLTDEISGGHLAAYVAQVKAEQQEAVEHFRRDQERIKELALSSSAAYLFGRK